MLASRCPSVAAAQGSVQSFYRCSACSVAANLLRSSHRLDPACVRYPLPPGKEANDLSESHHKSHDPVARSKRCSVAVAFRKILKTASARSLYRRRVLRHCARAGGLLRPPALEFNTPSTTDTKHFHPKNHGGFCTSCAPASLEGLSIPRNQRFVFPRRRRGIQMSPQNGCT